MLGAFVYFKQAILEITNLSVPEDLLHGRSYVFKESCFTDSSEEILLGSRGTPVCHSRVVPSLGSDSIQHARISRHAKLTIRKQEMYPPEEE